MPSQKRQFREVDNATETEIPELTPPRNIQFWAILSIEIPSLICTIYLLYHLLFKKRLREALHNHIIIVLLVCTFIVEVCDNPLYLDAYLQKGPNSFPPSRHVCLFWWLIDYGVYGAMNVFFTWASFERHLLIFSHKNLFNTMRKRFYNHYLPILLLIVYQIIFYIVVIIFPPCENQFDFEAEACGASPCYENIYWLNFWDYVVNGMFCTLLEFLFSLSLLFRIIYRRYLLRHSIYWKSYRRMTIQILSISALSLAITLPNAVITNIQRIFPSVMGQIDSVNDYYFFLTTFVVLLFPFVCLSCYSELWPTRWNLTQNRSVKPLIQPVLVRANIHQ